MGIGFCVVVSKGEGGRVFDLLKQEGIACHPLGYVVEDPERKILIPSKGLVGRNGRFEPL
jgi:phosphoribosylaminoimidazole (AIR) synthetase